MKKWLTGLILLFVLIAGGFSFIWWGPPKLRLVALGDVTVVFAHDLHDYVLQHSGNLPADWKVFEKWQTEKGGKTRWPAAGTARIMQLLPEPDDALGDYPRYVRVIDPEIKPMERTINRLIYVAHLQLGITNGTSFRTEGAASQIVATISSYPVSLAEVNPQKDVLDQKRGELTPVAFDQWLLAFRAERLVGLVESNLFQSYAIEKRLTPSDPDMERFSVMNREIRRESNDIIIQKVKASALLSEKQKENMLTGLETNGSSQKASDNNFARIMILNWNVQRSLHATYGGRLRLSFLGFHTAIDAVRKFLMDKEASGAFKLHDATLATAFWDTVAREKGDGLVDEIKATEILANPPWGA